MHACIALHCQYDEYFWTADVECSPIIYPFVTATLDLYAALVPQLWPLKVYKPAMLSILCKHMHIKMLASALPGLLHISISSDH